MEGRLLCLEWLIWYYIWFCQQQSKAGLQGYARLDRERVHCLRLIESCLDRELWKEVKTFVGAIWKYLDQQGWWTEELAALNMNLLVEQQEENRQGEAHCLGALGYNCHKRGDYATNGSVSFSSLGICKTITC